MKKFTQAALVTDALNLGSHWVYNQEQIARLYPKGLTEFTDPASQYHGTKKAGNLTHTGDQLFFLHEAIQRNGGAYDEEAWRAHWVEKMSSYTGYLDGATKTTLSTQGASPSESDEVAGAGRLAPLLDLDLSLEDTIKAAKSQTALTHGSSEIMELAEFIVRAVFSLKAGDDFKTALLKAAEEGSYTALNPTEHLMAAEEASTEDHLKTASNFGLTCHFPEAFPLTLYYALHFNDSFQDCISLNALAGGDNTARGILLSLLFTARDGDVGASLASGLKLPMETEKLQFSAGSNIINITGAQGVLSGVLELPKGEVHATAIFAHCFTCGKDFLPEKRVTQALAKRGIATLRIDFSGLGASGGEFSNTSFLTNLDDLVTASQWLGEQLSEPRLLVGHSLGGAAVLAAAKSIPSVKAVATIGAPADPAHVTHLFKPHLSKIEADGEAEVQLAGRSFTIGRRFLDDLKQHNQEQTLSSLSGVSTLIMHAPADNIVPLKNAGEIYSALPHPKSFIALDGADHLLTASADAVYVADLIMTWAGRVLR